MPCTPDTVCERPGYDLNTSYPNLINPSPVMHYANMGWVGYAWLNVGTFNNILRVTSADINLSQEIIKPGVIDGRIDPTVYQLGPKIVEGTLGMPLVADTQNPGNWTNRDCPSASDLGTAGSVLQNTWCWATARGPQGRLLWDDATLDVRYANHAAFTFDFCMVNTYDMKVTQGEAVTLDINVIGRGRTPHITDYDTSVLIGDYLAPARVLTWNDVTVNGIGGCNLNGDILFRSNQVREFTMSINNNAERFYTLCGSLFPVDINVGKREITGTLTLLGLQEKLRQLADTNQNRFTEKNEIRFAFYIGDDKYDGVGGFTPRDLTDEEDDASHLGSIFSKKLVGVVFEIETMSLTNDVFETSINWHAMADDQEGYEAISPGTSCSFPVWQ